MRINSTRTKVSPILTGLLAVLIFVPGCADDPVEPPPQRAPLLPTNGLIVFYLFNGNPSDASGNDNHAFLRGGAAVTDYLILGDNASDRVELPRTVLDEKVDFTISVWARINTPHTSGDHTIVSGSRAGQANAFYFLYHMPTNSWALALDNSPEEFDASATIRDLAWHHVLVLRDSGVARLYLDGQEIGDGVPVSDDAINLGIATGADGVLLLGQEQDGLGTTFDKDQSWAGDLDNLRIYNRALNPTEITALYNETGWGD